MTVIKQSIYRYSMLLYLPVLIGCFESFSEIRDHFQEYADKYKNMYRSFYSNNPEMLQYIE